MEKRLLLAHNLLTDNGVIFISIDDNEQANLKLLCDEIFKEINFVTCITRVTKSGGNKGDLYKPKKDYVLFYAKNVEAINKTTYGKLINMPHKWDAEIFLKTLHSDFFCFHLKRGFLLFIKSSLPLFFSDKYRSLDQVQQLSSSL